MNFKVSSDRIWLEDEDGKEIAFVSFPVKSENVVEIDHTVVDPCLRGQGVAGQLMSRLAEELRKSGRKAVPVCSYAAKWFEKHPECADLIQ